jgi:hypothetical protein
VRRLPGGLERLPREASERAYHDLTSIVESGPYLPYMEEEIGGAIAPPKADDRRAPCPDVYLDAPKIAFRNAVLTATAMDHLDAVVRVDATSTGSWCILSCAIVARCSR